MPIDGGEVTGGSGGGGGGGGKKRNRRRNRNRLGPNSWVWPTSDHHSNNPYGTENDRYEAGYHTGVDWSAQGTGSTVRAASSGRVILARPASAGSAYGNYVIIDHGNGIYTLYGHLNGYNVSVGDRVRTGQRIGAVGNSGTSSGAHLHFEVRKGDGFDYGANIDPVAWLKRQEVVAAPKGYGMTGSGGASGGGAGGFLGKRDKLSREEMAEKYGWAMSFLKSEPELWDLFQKAVQKEWSAAEFTAHLRDTKWFQTNSETVRKNLMLQETDPATWKDRLGEIKSTIKDLAASTGATMSKKQLERVAENALMFGWSDAQIQNALAEYVDRVKGSYVGEAGANEDELMAWARANGVQVDRKYVKKSVEQIAAGNWDMNRAKDRITRMAMSAFPALRDDLKAGYSVMDMAGAYINSMANILELNPADIDLFDPKIRRALSAKGQDGKPEMKTIWEFEHDLRSDERWLKTSNAQDAFMQTGRQVLKDMGLSF